MQKLLEKINQRVVSLKIPAKPEQLYNPVAYTLSLGGKRMRPLLTLLGYSLFKKNYERALDAAVAVEVFHNFTLLHDDIMDNAPIRRGKPTVWQKWGSSTAILSGDAMLILAYELLTDYEPVVLKKILPVFNKTALQVCEGQQLDMDFESKKNVSIADYLYMIELKTAVLLGSALKLGAIIAGAKEKDAELLYEFGKNTGIAFQLQDDILDVFGETEKVGKQTGGDIISNKKTFLLLKAFELADKKTAAKLKLLLNEKDEQKKVTGVKEIYHQLEVKKLAEKEMQKFYKKALSSLEKVNADTKKKKVLTDFTEQLMQRQS
ncbi:MAG: polyprenyl synthetase family protein [Bacteroidia bacterium]